jgi:hypothetical protein
MSYIFKKVDMQGLPNFFLAGCQKSATTWLHRCFREHPEIYVPEKHMIHFFDIHYAKGFDWYREFYIDRSGEKMIGDTTVSYIRDTMVPQRIDDYNPDAKLIFSLRNPIERAFSHYWHEKKKRKIAFEFQEVFANYDLYQSWVVPGFYYRHLQRFYEHFPEEQLMVVLVEDMARDPQAVIQRIFTFLGVAPDFIPSILHRQVNEAWYRPRRSQEISRRLYALTRPIRQLVPERVRQLLKDVLFGGENPGQIQSEYDRGMDPEVRAQLREVFQPENEKLARMLNRDLSSWAKSTRSSQ